MKLGHGFRFNPFEEELISFYLKPKVLGQSLPSNVVEERQLYGPNANPWQVFDPETHSWILSEVSPGRFEKVTYVFVNLTRKSSVERKNKAAKENYTKKAGCGTWDGQTKRYEIKDRITGDLVGEKRFLVFEINEVVSGLDLSKVGYWKMHEYHLCGVNEDISNPSNVVLCKITLDYSKTPPVKLKNIHDQPIKKKKSHNQNTNVTPPSILDSVDGNQGAICNHTRRDETDMVETCDGMEYMSSDYGKESEEVNTGHLNPASSHFVWPAKFDDKYQKIKNKRGGTRDFLFGMSKDQFCGSYSKPIEEQSVEDITTTNTRKRKKKS